MARLQKPGATLTLPEVSAPASVFYDSGSFTLWTTSKKYAKKNNCGIYDYYDTEEFWQYMNHYVHFIKAHPEAIDHYANVDVIPHPELSYRNLKWLESKGLKPVPVIHFTTPTKWITKHIDEGYDYIGLGGLVGSIRKASSWLDECWSIICDTPDRMPRVKVHGFGVTQHEAITRYPWYSVDAASWGKMGAFGTVLVPRGTLPNGDYDFTRSPMKLCVSQASNQVFGNYAYRKLTKGMKAHVDGWFEFLGIPLGEDNPDGTVKVPGVLNFHLCRRFVNMYYYWHMTNAMPKWPWPFTAGRAKPKNRLH